MWRKGFLHLLLILLIIKYIWSVQRLRILLLIGSTIYSFYIFNKLTINHIFETFSMWELIFVGFFNILIVSYVDRTKVLIVQCIFVLAKVILINSKFISWLALVVLNFKPHLRSRTFLFSYQCILHSIEMLLRVWPYFLISIQNWTTSICWRNVSRILLSKYHWYWFKKGLLLRT